jgi:hypothetical protein
MAMRSERQSDSGLAIAIEIETSTVSETGSSVGLFSGHHRLPDTTHCQGVYRIAGLRAYGAWAASIPMVFAIQLRHQRTRLRRKLLVLTPFSSFTCLAMGMMFQANINIMRALADGS